MQQEREWLDEQLAELDEMPATEADWRNFGDEINGASDANDVARRIHETRDGARKSRRVRAAEPKQAPADSAVDDGAAWDAYRQRLLQDAAGRIAARFARAGFGLAGPVSPESVAALLAKAREVERRVGQELSLEVPAIEDGRVVIAEEWTVYRGDWPSEPHDLELRQPLGFLASRAADLAARTGVRQVDAVLFLLCDLVVYWPPASTYVEWSPRFAIVARVEWPFFDPQGVAELVTRTRGSLYGLRADATAAERLAVGKRIMSAELAHFVTERRELGETWKSIHAAWEAAYPFKHFESPLSLRRTFQEANKRLPDMRLAPAPWRPAWRKEQGT